METKVWVTVEGCQQINNCSDSQKRECLGRFLKKGNFQYLTYLEHDPESGDTAQVTLKLDSNRLVMLRSGGLSSRMVFTPEIDTNCRYHTDAGTFFFRIHTDTLSIQMESGIGNIFLHYQLLEHENLLSCNTVNITVRPQNGQALI